MNIKEAEKATGVSVRNIRFYEQKGLLSPDRNRENDYRQYTEADVQRLQLIRALRMVDMPLEKIREVVDGEVTLHDAATAQKEKLEDKIKHLRTVIKFCGELSETQPEDVKEVLERMDKPENKKIFSKEWRTDYAEKIKNLCAFLAFPATALLLAFLRYVSIAIPSWCPYIFMVPGIYLRLISDGLFSNQLILLEAIFWPVAYGALLLFQSKTKIRRYLLRPALTLLVIFGLSTYAVQSNDAWEDAIWDHTVSNSHSKVQDFIQIADEAYTYANSYYTDSHYLDALPEIAIDGRYVMDTMMIDYDTMTLGFCYNYVGKFELKTFQLEADGQIPESYTWKNELELEGSGGTLTMYFDYRDGWEGNGSTTTCIALTMPDGTVYTAQKLTNPKTGYSYFVGHIAGGEFERIEDFLEKKQN